MNLHAIQTGEVQIKSRHVEARFHPRAARVADILADPRHRVVVAPSHDPESSRRLAESAVTVGSRGDR